MQKQYLRDLIRNRRASSLSILASALIASLFLSFLSSIFYNLWVYEVEGITLEEGSWQGRLTGELTKEDELLAENFAQVENARFYPEMQGESEPVLELWFERPGRIYEELPKLAAQLEIGPEGVSYHETLLSRYLIHDPEDPDPPLLISFYLAVFLITAFSLILIIRNSFGVSMQARLRHFGILAAVGAAPSQIRAFLLQEAAFLCAAPILAGSVLGTALSYGTLVGMESLAGEIAGRHEAVWRFHPAVFLAAFLSSALTVLFSAWLPAWKLSRMTPLEAMRGRGELRLKRRKRFSLLGALFGMEGELAGNGLKAQRKTLRASTVSLTLSFLGFSMMLCFFSLSELSTKYTYFERYQDVWDVMVTVRDCPIGEFEQTEDLKGLPEASDLTVYQKAEAFCLLPREAVGTELEAAGGPLAFAGEAVSQEGDFFRVRAPLVVLDDASFEAFCEELGVLPEAGGAVVLNQFWDSKRSNFRYREYLPFVKEEERTLRLESLSGEGKALELPVAAFTDQVPALKEEYADYSLVQFLPQTLWESVSELLGGAEEELYIRALAKERTSLSAIRKLESEILERLPARLEAESENRMEERIANDRMLAGYRLILGGLCGILALIGVANVFSYTLGFLGQRRREFAQYLSVGMTPGGLKKMFCIEALVIAGRPLFFTLPLTIAFVLASVSASHLKLEEFLPAAPVLPIFLFAVLIAGFVGLAYYLGARRIFQEDLSQALRNDGIL